MCWKKPAWGLVKGGSRKFQRCRHQRLKFVPPLLTRLPSLFFFISWFGNLNEPSQSGYTNTSKYTHTHTPVRHASRARSHLHPHCHSLLIGESSKTSENISFCWLGSAKLDASFATTFPPFCPIAPNTIKSSTPIRWQPILSLQMLMVAISSRVCFIDR